MKFSKLKITRLVLEVRNPEEPSHQFGDDVWYHRTRPAEVDDIVALLRGDPAVRTAVLDGLEGTDPRLPDLSANRVGMRQMQQDIPPGMNWAGNEYAVPKSGNG